LQRLGLRRGSECFRCCCGVSFSVLFCPSCSGQQTASGPAPEDSTSGGGSPTRHHGRAERSGGLHETERSAVEEAWGYPSGGGRAQVGRSGRQAKRCPNMGAEGTEETAGLAVQQSVSQNRRLEAFIVRDQIRERPCDSNRRAIPLPVSADRSGSRSPPDSR